MLRSSISDLPLPMIKHRPDRAGPCIRSVRYHPRPLRPIRTGFARKAAYKRQHLHRTRSPPGFRQCEFTKSKSAV